MGLKFFHLPSHRVFDYKPLYHDPQQEKLEQGVDTTNSQEEYVPGSIVSKGFRRNIGKRALRKDSSYSPLRRVLVYILIAAILIALLYFTKAFATLIELMKVQG